MILQFHTALFWLLHGQRHRVSDTDEDCGNDSADGNVRAKNPSDITKFYMTARVKSLSSTIDITGTPVNGSFHFRFKRPGSDLYKNCEHSTT
jgi:hypothetical protein